MMLTDDISLWSAKVYLDTSNYLLNFWLNLRCSCIRRWEIRSHVYRDEQKEAQPLWFVSQDTPKHIWVLVPTTSMLLPPLLFYWVAQKQAASSAKLCVFALFVIVSVFFAHYSEIYPLKYPYYVFLRDVNSAPMRRKMLGDDQDAVDANAVCCAERGALSVRSSVWLLHMPDVLVCV